MAIVSSWETMPPTDLVSDRHFRELTIFEMRVAELNSNWFDLFPDGGVVHIKANRTRPFVEAQMPETNPHRLKGLYADYRVFTLQSDGINFGYVANLVKRYFRHTRVIEEIEQLKKRWKDDLELGEWFGHSSDEIFDAYFNAALFHGNEEKMDVLEEIIVKMEDKSLHANLTYQIGQHRILLNNLRLFVEPFVQGSNWIRVPRRS